MLALTRIILLRASGERRHSARAEPKVYALISSSPTIDLRVRAKALQAALKAIGKHSCIVGEEGEDMISAWFDALEHDHDVVLLITPDRRYGRGSAPACAKPIASGCLRAPTRARRFRFYRPIPRRRDNSNWSMSCCCITLASARPRPPRIGASPRTRAACCIGRAWTIATVYALRG